MAKGKTRRPVNGPSNKAVFVVLLVALLGVGALAWYVKGQPSSRPQVELRPPEPPQTPQITRPSYETSERNPVANQVPAQTVLVPAIEQDRVGDLRKTEVPEGREPKAFLAEQILRNVHFNDAGVLGVDVRTRTAVINFSRGIDSGMGSEQEGLFVTALQKGFGQFPEIDKLMIEKEGEPLDSVGGHIELTDGLPVTRPSSDQGPAAGHSAPESDGSKPTEP